MFWATTLCFILKKYSHSHFSCINPIHHHINTPIHQHINTSTSSTHQHINTSTHQHINTSTHQHINTSTHEYISAQHISPSTSQHIINTSTRHWNTSTRQHINASTHQHTSGLSVDKPFNSLFECVLLLSLGEELNSRYNCLLRTQKNVHGWHLKNWLLWTGDFASNKMLDRFGLKVIHIGKEKSQYTFAFARMEPW